MPGTHMGQYILPGHVLGLFYNNNARDGTHMGQYIRPGHVLGLFYNNNARDGTHMGQYLYDWHAIVLVECMYDRIRHCSQQNL